MGKRTVCFILLLPLWAVTAHNDLKFIEKGNNTGNHKESVLIRTKRRWVLSTIELIEEDSPPFPKLATQLFNDYQASRKIRFHISGQGVTEDPIGLLTVDDMTGEVYVHGSIDREMYPFFMVKFDVEDRDTNQIVDKTLSFNVAVKDINDNAPTFMPDLLRLQIPENMKEGLLPTALKAMDIDEKNNNNSRITMRVVSQEPKMPPISLKILTGNPNEHVIAQLIFTGCFDYDIAKNFKLLVEARDWGTPALSSTATVFIDVTDSNTHQPVFTASTYNAQVMEMESNKEILRLSVEDKDTPNTPGSKARYKIIKGNEEGNYKIETDPKTNEGVLTVIKGKDYETTTLAELEIVVENEEPLFLCVNGKPVSPGPENAPRSAKVAVKVIDVNDPPKFLPKSLLVYKKEEEPPGALLYSPEITDEDSDVNKIKYKLAEDPAKWLTIDPKTGKVTTVKKMDRESPFVVNNTYTAVIHAIDDGEPPATGTGTLVIHLMDMNDNTPQMLSRNLIMCGNKANRVTVTAMDADLPPFQGPFTFSLGGDNKELNSIWKFEPTTGMETSLISLTSLPYENYTVPLKIADQQGQIGEDVLHVLVCDCGEDTKCPGLQPRSSSLHGAAIGILLGSMLLMALLLCLCFACNCQDKRVNLNLLDEGSQTLINYNEEGGGALCKTLNSPTGTLRPGCIQLSQFPNTYEVNNGTMKNAAKVSSPPFQDMAENNGTLMSQPWSINRTNTYKSGTGRYSRSYSVMSDWHVEEHLERRLYEISAKQLDVPEYHPREYNDEGLPSQCPSLDKLSLSSAEDDLSFLQNLGPKFHTLDTICQQSMKAKNLKL